MNRKETYDNARRAVRDSEDPEAFLHLGMLYTKGIGTKVNNTLANYYYGKALALGAQVAEEFFIREYADGSKDFLHDISNFLKNPHSVPHMTLNRFRTLLEWERHKKYYGLLSQAREHLYMFYPDYNIRKAMDDILNDRNTVDADLLFATSTEDNKYEYNISQLDSFLQQLLAPHINIAKASQLEDCHDLWNEDERDLVNSIEDLVNSYNNVCKKNNIEPLNIISIKTLQRQPHIDVSTMATIRRQAFRCLLSIKDIDPLISNEFMSQLEHDEELMNIIEKLSDTDLLTFLFSFVEQNIYILALEKNYQELLSSYRRGDLEDVAAYVNEKTHRLNEASLKHEIPTYTTDNLPQIDLNTEQ